MQKSANNNPISIGPMPWWGVEGSPGEQVNSSTTTAINQVDWIGEHQKSATPTKEKQSVFHLAFSAENMNSLKESNVHDHQTNNFQQLSPSQQKNYFELGLGQPMVYANYHPLVDQCHGLFALYGTQPTAMGHVMLPFSVTTEDGPMYVNPKQYHGILRRRKKRAKEGMKSRSARDKPYIHESRHRHACRRARGAGGRFLNSKNPDENKKETKKTSDQLTFLSSQSSSSDVLQSEGGNLNSSKELSDCKSSNFSGSEVTSMYYSKEFECFGLNSGRPFAFHPIANMEGSRQGGSCVTASDGCCNLFKF